MLSHELGDQLYGELFRALRESHKGDGFDLLGRIYARFTDGLYSKIEDDGPTRLGLLMSKDPEAITPRIKVRAAERLGREKVNARLARMFVVAHELGHCVQDCIGFDSLYGGPIDRTIGVPEKDYAAYLGSDLEVNADFIAVRTLGRVTGLGTLSQM